MKNRIVLIIATIILTMLIFDAVYAVQPNYNNVELMKISEVKRGMKGVGYTVFEGMKVEEFNVEILGSLINKNQVGSYILQNSKAKS